MAAPAEDSLKLGLLVLGRPFRRGLRDGKEGNPGETMLDRLVRRKHSSTSALPDSSSRPAASVGDGVVAPIGLAEGQGSSLQCAADCRGAGGRSP